MEKAIRENNCLTGNRLRVKAVVGFLLALALIAAVFFCAFDQGKKLIRAEEAERNAIRLVGIQSAINWIAETADQSQDSFELYLQTDMELICIAMRNAADIGPEKEPFLIDNGAVVRVGDGIILWPDGIPLGLDELSPESLTSDFSCHRMLVGAGDDDLPTNTIVSVRNIRDDWYCLKWIPSSKMTQYMINYVEATENLNSIVRAYGGSFYVVDNENPGIILYTSDDLSAHEQTGELGLSPETLELKPQELTILGTSYISLFAEMEKTGSTLVFLVPAEMLENRSFSWGVPVGILSALFLAGLLVWILSVQFCVRDSILTEEQKKQYCPRRVFRNAVIIMVLGIVAVLGTAAVVEMISSIQMDAERNLNTLEVLENRMTLYAEQKENIRQEKTNWYFDYLEDAAELLARDAGIRNHETLYNINRAVNGKYLTLYDEDGKEIASSEEYVGFTLGTTEDSQTTDFRRLNLGIRRIVHEAETDEMTGETVQFIGVPVRINDSGLFGALILATEPVSLLDDLDREEINAFVEYIGQVNHQILAVDEDGLINYARDEKYRGRKAADLGLRKETRKDGSVNSYWVNGNMCYGCCRKIGDLYFYIFTESDHLTKDALPYGLNTAAVFACACVILILFLMAGYTTKAFDQYASVGKTVLQGNVIRVVLPDGRTKRSVDPSGRWRFFQDAWKQKSPEQKTKQVMQTITVVLMFLIIWNTYTSGRNGRFTLLSYILQGQWERGLNIFAAASILLLLAGVTIGLFAVRTVLQLLGKVLGARGETVCRLVFSIIRYISIILVFFYAFGFLGIDTTALLAGVSLLSLAVSIGSKDLVADILAGINIVFEGEFQVGDTIEIGGYRGVVQEIGIRSTKIIGMGDNVKIIGNRDVKNVLNLSRMNSWCALEFKVPVNADLEKLEEILNRELPEIGSQIPEVISGPVYKGVSAMAGGTMTLTILAECREEYMRRVQRRLNAKVRAVLNREGIPFS